MIVILGVRQGKRGRRGEKAGEESMESSAGVDESPVGSINILRRLFLIKGKRQPKKEGEKGKVKVPRRGDGEYRTI